MPMMSAEGMAAIKMKRIDKQRTLAELISGSFNINTKEHLDALKTYVDEFELYANQMYVYQASSAGIRAWIGCTLVSYLIPIPQTVTHLFAFCLYVGITGCILKNFSEKDFYDELNYMKSLYTWCMKKGNDEHKPCSENDVLLSNLQVQRMIKLMAPLCEAEFMIAWEPKSQQSQTNQSWFSWLSSTKPNLNQNIIDELKINVENKRLNLSVGSGFERALKYFTTDQAFRQLLTTKAKQIWTEFTVSDWMTSTLSPNFKLR